MLLYPHTKNPSIVQRSYVICANGKGHKSEEDFTASTQPITSISICFLLHLISIRLYIKTFSLHLHVCQEKFKMHQSNSNVDVLCFWWKITMFCAIIFVHCLFVFFNFYLFHLQTLLKAYPFPVYIPNFQTLINLSILLTAFAVRFQYLNPNYHQIVAHHPLGGFFEERGGENFFLVM